MADRHPKTAGRIRPAVVQVEEEQMLLMQRSMPEELMSRLAYEAANEPITCADGSCRLEDGCSTGMAEGHGSSHTKLPLAGRKRDSETEWTPWSGPPPPYRRNPRFDDPTDTWSNRGVRRNGGAKRQYGQSNGDGFIEDTAVDDGRKPAGPPTDAGLGREAFGEIVFASPGDLAQGLGRQRVENPFAASLLAAVDCRQPAALSAQAGVEGPPRLNSRRDAVAHQLLDRYLAGREAGTQGERGVGTLTQKEERRGEEGVAFEGGGVAEEEERAPVPLRRKSRHHSLEAEMLKAQWPQADALFDLSPFQEVPRVPGLRTAAERASSRPLSARVTGKGQLEPKSSNSADQAAANAFTLFLHGRSGGATADSGSSPEDREGSGVKRLQARVAQLEAQNLAEVERAKAAAARAAHLEDKLGKAKQQVQSWRKLYLEEVHANKQRR